MYRFSIWKKVKKRKKKGNKLTKKVEVAQKQPPGVAMTTPAHISFLQSRAGLSLHVVLGPGPEARTSEGRGSD